jgi:hypothetical protein
MTLNTEGQRVAWLLQRSYKPPKRRAQAHGVGIVAFRFHLPRRLAARNSVSLGDVAVAAIALQLAGALWALRVVRAYAKSPGHPTAETDPVVVSHRSRPIEGAIKLVR